MMYKIYLTLIILFCTKISLAQGVSINTTGQVPDTSAILDVSSINKGLLIPRMTDSQRLAIANPIVGLLVFQTNINPCIYYFDGTIWQPLCATKKDDEWLIYTSDGF